MSDGVGRDELAEWIAYLRDIGVRELRGSPGVVDRATSTATDPDAPRPAVVASPAAELPMDETSISLANARSLDDVRGVLGECTRCKLHATRTNIVFGVGNPSARVLFIGEGPGADEDARGEPFVGRAGKKLDEMIEKGVGLARAEVYIANIVKCRPPGNRDPQPDEVGACSPFLFAQIATIRPEVIVTLGSPATKTLLRTKVGITKLRGTWHDFGGIPLLPTYHPAYLLRAYTVENRRKVYEDMLAVKDRLGLGA